MKRSFCMLLSLVLLIMLFPSSYAAADNSVPFSDDPKAIQVASNSVIMLSCYDKDGNLYATGSAFAAFEEGVFLTNFHVLENGIYSIRAAMESGLEFTIPYVVAYDVEKDLAILRTEAKTGLEPLPIGSSTALERGEKVIAIGSPLGLINTLSIGLNSGTIKDENDQVFLQFSAPISHGSSGGALFNNRGEVVGITSASFTEGQNLNLAIPIEAAVNLWESCREKGTIEEICFPLSDLAALSPSPIQANIDELFKKYTVYDGKVIQTDGYISYDTETSCRLFDNPSDAVDNLNMPDAMALLNYYIWANKAGPSIENAGVSNWDSLSYGSHVSVIGTCQVIYGEKGNFGHIKIYATSITPIP